MTDFQRPDLDSLSPDELIDSVRIWYHELELAGRTTPGAYAMAPVAAHDQIPARLDGLQVVDVGASNGYSSFLFESRGAARVVATELPRFEEHDYPRWYIEQERERRTAKEVEEIDWHELHGGFQVAHRILGSKVERVLTRVYDLPETCPGPFDLAFCSNVFVHLQNPVAAMEAIRQVLAPGGQAIFATPIAIGHEGLSGADFVGEPEYCAWWVPTLDGFVKMCEVAGFTDVPVVTSFVLGRQHGEAIVDQIGVIHCDRAAGR